MISQFILLNVAAEYDTRSDDYPKLDWEFFIGPMILLLIYGVIAFFALKLLWRLLMWSVKRLYRRFY